MTVKIVQAATQLRPNETCYTSSSPKYRLEKDITILHDIIKWAPFELKCKKFGWVIQLGLNENVYTLKINDVQFEAMVEATARERAALARTAISMKMDGQYKSAKFCLLLKGK